MNNWLIFALLSAAAAAATGLFAKIGMKNIDSTMATAVRSIIGTFYLVGLATAMGKWPHLKSLNPKSTVMVILAGLAGATSWLFYYRALQLGRLPQVAAVDKLSVPLAAILAVLFLGDRLSLVNWLGIALVAAGAYLVAYKPAGIL